MSGMAIIQDTIARSLDAPPSLSPWFTTSYLMALSASVPIVGRLAGAGAAMPRILLLPAAAIFCAGALLAASASSAAVFIGGRVLAGVGGGAFLALAFVFVLALVPEPRRGIGLGVINAAITVGVSLGAVVYGGLLSAVGWRERQRPLFWMQAPVAFVAALAVFLCTPASIQSDQKHRESPSSLSRRLVRIDYLGAVLLCLTVVLFLYGLASTVQPLILGLSIVSLAAFIACEYLVAVDPVLPLTLLSSRGVLLSCISQLGLMAARWSLLFFAPIFILAVHGAPRSAAGSVLVPTNLGFAVGGIVVGSLHIRRTGSFWLSCLIALAFFSASILGLAIVASPRAALTPLIALVFINGFATGAALNYTMAHLLHLCHPDTEYVAASLLATFRGFGGSFGTSIGGGMFYRFLRRSLARGFLALDGGQHLSPAHSTLIPRLLGMPELVLHGGLSSEEQKVALNGYAGAIGFVWMAAAILMLMVMAAQAATGWTAPKPLRSADTVAHRRDE
ncbi:Major facilitator superfamily domain, general substrate transporter [Ophiocordyceps camponoti-floridani]|uniref:Major facilitator superfamily domain, general substrate transporter n=1 Tax=Ophiocordyceps camponoti-floridani TaxID=2030778 RepID=A0A8H4QD20_9HYPO|nr:Major facilitator superfamily domain, general substrate transporter [Ophiocordyceps camponoti-floridani]